MSFFFDQPTPSQSSQNQNTAFFQNGQTPKASIFDTHAQSQSQIAYDLFNIQSNEVEEKERSIISKLDILDRIKQEESFAHNSTPYVPISQSNFKVQSQQSKMTFGNKFSSNLRQSKVDEKKDKKNRHFDEGNEKEKEPRSRLKLHEPLSNFSFYRSQHSNTRLQEPQSMPIKFQEQKKPSKKKFFDNASSKSSSISIDFDQIRQRQQQQSTPTTTASKMQSLKFTNEEKKVSKIESKPQMTRGQRSLDNHKQITEDSKNERQTIALPKQRKFQFNLRKSRVTQQNKTPIPPPQKTFFTKINLANNVASHGSATISNQIPIVQNKPQNILKSDVKRVSQGNNLFKSRAKETTQKVMMPSTVKAKQNDKGLNLFKNITDQSKTFKLQKSSKTKLPDQQRKSLVSHDKYESLMQTFDKDSSISVDSRSQTSSKGKRESIGLKQQLKKLSSRPTEKVQLKSIAFNKSFKFKQTKPAEEKPMQPKIEIKQLVKQIQDSINQIQPKSKPTVEKNYLLPVKTTRNSQFSHFMLTLIELQQECQSLRQRTIQSRNSYRELAILNDDINRRIDQCLNRRK